MNDNVRLQAFGFLICCILSGCTKPPASLVTLKVAEKIVVYEGLPHQLRELELLKQELQRDDICTLGGFPFYSPGVTASPEQERQLKKVLCDGNLYYRFEGEPADCGPFHPDFAVEWLDGEVTKQALFCFGCNEVQILSGGEIEEYDFKETRKLKAVFSDFSDKRPMK